MRTPYDADHVSIVHQPGRVVALYIPDPVEARRPRYVLDNILDRSRYENVEVITEAVRYYRYEGADFSGWIVTSRTHYSDPIPNKPQAMEVLHRSIREYFER